MVYMFSQNVKFGQNVKLCIIIVSLVRMVMRIYV